VPMRSAPPAREWVARLRGRVGCVSISARRTLLVALTLVFVGGCISEEREQAIGDTLAADVNPHLPLVDDPLVNAYLYSVGRQLVAVSTRPELEYSFYIVNTGAVNAFALPGGHIYLTRGLIERTEDGAEFAGVLAHEIAHVSARHGIRKLQRELRTGSVVSVLYEALFGGEPALLRDNSLQLAGDVWSASHSRRDEREADRLAVKYLMRTGVDPDGVVTLLETLLEEEIREGEHREHAVDWFSTHPLTTRRIEEARRNIQKLAETTPAELRLDLDAFPAFKILVLHRAPFPSETGW
jgi:beta-barrel assembly-enhancing protease